jgi:hypothetical protein
MALDVRQGIDRAREAWPDEAAEMRDAAVKARAERATVEDVLADEAPKGYDFLMIGLDPAQMPEGGFNPEIAKSRARSTVPSRSRSPAGSTKATRSQRR